MGQSLSKARAIAAAGKGGGTALSKARALAAEGRGGGRAWSDLPDVALHGIVMKLSSPYAFSAFAGVCSSWRSVARSSKQGFISSQPPLLLTIPPSPPTRYQFRLYSVSEKRSYNARSPFLARVLQNFTFWGHSHGYLIALDRRTRAPTLVNLCTQEMICLPETPPFVFPRALLTSPIGSGNCTLLLYEHGQYYPRIAYCRVADPSKRWHTFSPPKIHGKFAALIYSITVLEDILYVGICAGYVMVVDISRDPFNVVRVIEHPSTGLTHGVLRAQDGELISITFTLKIPDKESQCIVQRLELSKMGEGNWVEGLGACRSVFIESWVLLGSVWWVRMRGVDENGIYHPTSKYKVTLFPRAFGTFRSEDGRYCWGDKDDRVWVFPSDYEQWGFKGF